MNKTEKALKVFEAILRKEDAAAVLEMAKTLIAEVGSRLSRTDRDRKGRIQ